LDKIDFPTSRNVAKRSIGNKLKTNKNTEKIVRKPSTTSTTDKDPITMNEGIFYDFFVFFFKWYLLPSLLF
jgi:hypothetical protein